MKNNLIELIDISKSFTTADKSVAVLKDINITITHGEFVAIVGPSGSGKSTLMNILGGLDYPTSGHYYFKGENIAQLDRNHKAILRRKNFGFIFQSYHLLTYLTALENIEVPAFYAGQSESARKARACDLLEQLGLPTHGRHRPTEMSGGQQQRVSIARALINSPEVILADEPTGALDQKTGGQVMAILDRLHSMGHTVIVITHDMDVARHASRIIRIQDGTIVEDCPQVNVPVTGNKLKGDESPAYAPSLYQNYSNALCMAIKSMASHRLRTALTMLGIIIGIASVVVVMGLAKGAQDKIINQINSLGTNTISIFPGTGWGDDRAYLSSSLGPHDYQTLKELKYLDGVSPVINIELPLRMGNKELNGSVFGVSSDYFKIRGLTVSEGRVFSSDAEETGALVAVIEEKGRQSLFDGISPLDRIIMVGNIPVRVIGVVKDTNSNGFAKSTITIWLTQRSVTARFFPSDSFTQIVAKVKDGIAPSIAEEKLTELIVRHHGTKDFFTESSDRIIKEVIRATATLKLMVTGIAVISLLVGGIGVMNIMLVSVTERTREIGVRISLGAKGVDIMRQFLVEAVAISLFAGAFGILLALCVSWVIPWMFADIPVVLSWSVLGVSFMTSFVIGVIFGYLPALKASVLNPVQALSAD